MNLNIDDSENLIIDLTPQLEEAISEEFEDNMIEKLIQIIHSGS